MILPKGTRVATEPSLALLLTASAAMIAATTFVHVLFAQAGAAAVRAVTASRRLSVRLLRDSVVLVIFTLWLMTAHVIEMWMWALLFLRLGLFETLELSLYFAAVSYTTLGFGGRAAGRMGPPLRGGGGERSSSVRSLCGDSRRNLGAATASRRLSLTP